MKIFVIMEEGDSWPLAAGSDFEKTMATAIEETISRIPWLNKEGVTIASKVYSEKDKEIHISIEGDDSGTPYGIGVEIYEFEI